MGRVTVHIADDMLSALDGEAHNRSISRSQAVAKAIEFFIAGDNQKAHNELSEAHNKLSASEEEVMRLKQELSELEDQIAERNKALESSSTEVMRLTEEVKRIVKLHEEAEHNKEDLKNKYDQSLVEATQRWEELKGYKSEVTKQKKLLEESQATIQHLKDDLLKRQSETDQLAKTREELASARMEANKLQEAINLRNQDVSFLQGHVSQLTQSISQFALKPGDEEIKKNGWWKFWK
jgi:chromosome segregation ATPase